MKLVYLNDWYFPFYGGVEKVVKDMGEELVKKGNEVHVITHRYQSDLLPDEVINGVQVHRIGKPTSSVRSLIDYAIKARKHVLKIKPDVIQMNYQGFNPFTGFLLKTLNFIKIPRILHVHSDFHMFPPEAVDFSLKYLWLDTCVFRYANKAFWKWDKIVTTSNYMKQNLLDLYHLNPAQIDVIYNGIHTDTDDFNSSKEKEPPEILFVGVLQNRKDPFTLLKACHYMQEDCPDLDFRVRFVGDGTLKDWLWQQSCSLNIQNKTIFTGRVSAKRLKKYFSECSVLCVPSVYEPFGLVFCEAMANCKPVIGTNVGGIPEVVEHGKSGILVSKGDADAICDALIKLLPNPDLRHKMGSYGRKIVEDRFSWDKIIPQWIKLYDELI